MRKTINIPGTSAPIGPYSPALLNNGTLYVSGQLPINPVTGEMVQGDISVQTRQVMENISALLKETGMDFSDVVKTTIFLADMNDFAQVNEAYSAYFKDNYPARETVQVARLPKDARIEISVIASL
ncbi:MAG: RidA family protein [Bacteroidales bacterium]|jgi:2-iminobutanoate/2-iminopropanoate deaminase|nr:RidA family protein [Bacteroidales bacterium]MDD4213971.1 RidA family protein [Bacteroidales bacterium]